MPGDGIWVSGVLGDAALGLAWLKGRLPPGAPAPSEAVRRLQRPAPRVELGKSLCGLATSAIDVSDGLAGDLGHILMRSSVGARIEWSAIPRSPEMHRLDEERQKDFVLAGGDDYELLFTAPSAAADAVAAAARAAGVSITRIGTIVADAGLVVIGCDGRAVDTAARAFDHFR